MRMGKHGYACLSTLCCAIAIAGCEGPRVTDDGGRDAGMMEVDSGGDVCAGRDLCTAAGTTCEGDALVECAEDADGCLVETRTDCGASGDICDDGSGTPACVDPCTLIPEADRCSTDGDRACDGETLEVCAMNADGCLVLERTQCDASAGGLCDDSGTMPVCALPLDPCAGVAGACTTAGTTCDADTLVTCAPNAFGCLVETRTDCTERAGGTCDGSATPAPACVFTGDPCAGVTECTSAGASCDGPVLVTCAADAFGCMVETRSDCTDTMFGFCDEAASPSPTCSTAATDPCMGVTECGTEPSRTCTDRGTLDVCAANAFGCYVQETTDCTATSEVCDASGGTAMCVDACSLVTTCPSATYCDGGDVVTCIANADGCLVEDSRSTCGTGLTCDASGTAATCVDAACPVVEPAELDCASGTVSGNTAGGSTLRSAYECAGTYSYPGSERIYRFRNTGATRMAVEIVATRGTSTADFDLFALDGTGTSCTDAALSCLDSSTGTTDTETVELVADAGGTAYIAYDIYDSSTDTTDFTLAVTCTPIVCGDSAIVGDEACDDGNTTAGDGCSATCAVETGFVCSGAPSTCVMLPANAMCAGATSITGTTTLTGEDVRLGGTPPSGTGCGGGSGTTALYYAVIVPDATTVTVTATPGAPSWDPMLLVLGACSDTTCADSEDSSGADGAETLAFTNTSGAAVTQIVAVTPWDAAAGVFDLSVTYAPICGNGTLDGAEACDDGNSASGDGCSSSCTIETGYSCSGTPSTCVAIAANATCATATAISGTITLPSEDLRGGGAPPTATGCTSATGASVLYYSLTVPDGASVDVTVTPGAPIWDPVILRLDSCSATMCAASEDSTFDGEVETMSFTNTSGAPATHIIAVRSYYADAGPFVLSVRYVTPGCGGGAVEAGEQCDDGNTTAGDGCSPTCTLEAADATFTATDTPLAIPDDDPVGITSSLTATACTITWVRATWSISHTYASDLDVVLVAPDGARVTLSTDDGGGSDLTGPYTFATGGASWPPSGDPLAPGTYAADFSALIGDSAAGTWGLEAADFWSGDVGTIDSWTLELGCM